MFPHDIFIKFYGFSHSCSIFLCSPYEFPMMFPSKEPFSPLSPDERHRALGGEIGAVRLLALQMNFH